MKLIKALISSLKLHLKRDWELQQKSQKINRQKYRQATFLSVLINVSYLALFIFAISRHSQKEQGNFRSMVEMINFMIVFFFLEITYRTYLRKIIIREGGSKLNDK